MGLLQAVKPFSNCENLNASKLPKLCELAEVIICITSCFKLSKLWRSYDRSYAIVRKEVMFTSNQRKLNRNICFMYVVLLFFVCVSCFNLLCLFVFVCCFCFIVFVLLFCFNCVWFIVLFYCFCFIVFVLLFVGFKLCLFILFGVFYSVVNIQCYL